MIHFEFLEDKVLLQYPSWGGLMNVTITYERYPALKALSAGERAKLGVALTLATAHMDGLSGRANEVAANAMAEAALGPAIIVPPSKIQVP